MPDTVHVETRVGTHATAVWFARPENAVELTLIKNGNVIAKSASAESIARELQILGARELSIEDKFVTELPTSDRTLKQAAALAFSEPLAALKLIAACAAIGEFAAIMPERRARPRAEKVLG